jgi:hypothetical protein
MTDAPKKPGMIGPPPSASQVPLDAALHAQDFPRRYAVPLDQYCAARMDELGKPDDKQGAEDLKKVMRWRTFNPYGRDGGNITKGVTVNSGALNPDLLKGQKGRRIWAKARLKDRIDAIIAHEWAESKSADHQEALKAAAKTELPVTEGAKRILKAMAR